MVAEREGVDRLGSKEPARTRRPPPVLPQQQGDTRVPRHIKMKFIYRAGSAVCQNRLAM